MKRAVAAFTDAVGRWAKFGNVLEEPYARLGLGRSLHALSDPEAPECLGEARALFSGMGAHAPLAVCDPLVGSLSNRPRSRGVTQPCRLGSSSAVRASSSRIRSARR